jgi:polysaccharide biosynthesis protein PslH
MRILYVLPFVPWVGRNRSYHVIPRLGKKHEIFLLCRSTSAKEEAYAQEIESYCRQVRFVRHSRARLHGALRCALALPSPTPLRMAYFTSARMKAAVREAASDFSPDLIYVERWRTLQWIPDDIEVPIVADPTDSMLLYNTRLISAGCWWEKIIGLEEALKFQWYEPRLSRRSAVNIYISEVDLHSVARRAAGSRFAIVGNGVDIHKFSYKDMTEECDDTIVFSGNFDYKPNRHAVDFFLKSIFPAIRRSVPSAKFAMVGNGATRYYGHLNSGSNMEVRDFVPELRPYLAKATVAVAPMTLAVGVLTKLLEAFAVGTSVVATSRACEGLPVQNGEHLFIEDTPSEFADKVVRLLQDQQLRRQVAANARNLVETSCDWDITTARMEELMCQVARLQRDSRQPEPVLQCNPTLQV